MNDNDAVQVAINAVLPERLRRLRRVSGAQIVFGGTTRPASAGRELVLSHLAGTFGDSLRGLVVPSGLGLGGAVVHRSLPCRINDYATTSVITHDYDRIVVQLERITSIFAVPVITRGVVHGVLYGAVRHQQPIGDRAVRDACVIAAQLQHELGRLTTPPVCTDDTPPSASAALAELAEIIPTVADSGLRERLVRVQRGLGGRSDVQRPATSRLAPREVDVLRRVAVGFSNVEIAADLGLSPETVKAYLRSSMRKLGARNRTAAAHSARSAGVL